MKSKRIRKGRVFTHVISATRTTSCQLFIKKKRDDDTKKLSDGDQLFSIVFLLWR